MNLLNKADILGKNKLGAYLTKQVAMRMKARDISIMELENKADVKTHAVRNILRGKSKSPSAVNLQAIADFLGCAVKDLLDIPEALQEDDESESLDEILIKKYVEYA
ncbi:MAG: helix-turn-helix transcriptional regulator, partial [Alphaproteobacteria bacterium]|nr:helix-turn-helix transcriptional regulator [Alphaproteobacteria bacterium]